MKRTLVVCLLLLCIPLFCVSAIAQVNVKLGWDAGGCQGTVENPINFRLYDCSNADLSTCNMHEVGTSLTYGPISLAHQSTTWFYATCWNYAIVADGVLLQPQESGKSNILQVKAFAPPGNPGRNRITVTQIGAEGDREMTLLAELK